MKQKYWPLLFAVVLLLSATAVSAESGSVYVTVREAKLLPKQEFWAPPVADLSYGDRLAVLSEHGDWIQVKDPHDRTGYVHRSAISNRRVVLNSLATFSGGNPNTNDVVLAGKGFSSKIEKEYAAEHSGLNFQAVDAMERHNVSSRALSRFISAGELKSSEG
jgi:hypothetical protein